MNLAHDTYIFLLAVLKTAYIVAESAMLIAALVALPLVTAWTVKRIWSAIPRGGQSPRVALRAPSFFSCAAAGFTRRCKRLPGVGATAATEPDPLGSRPFFMDQIDWAGFDVARSRRSAK